MDEFELIRRYFERPSGSPFVVTGIGDDGAVLRPSEGRELVSVIDTLVAGTHFPTATGPADIGYRAVAVNLSDIAAMGATPRWMTLALTLPDGEPAWVGEFARGLHTAAAEHGVQLVGGDTTRGEQVVVSVQITGDVPAGKAIHRNGAAPCDRIFVSGCLGDAAAGLQQLERGDADAYLVARFLRPTARVDLGKALSGRASAAIDLSDGLVADLTKLVEASGTGAELRIDRLPLSDALVNHAGRERALQCAMGGGDDYELCFTLPPSQPPDDLPGSVTEIGTITGGSELTCHDGDELVPFETSGYRHFQ